VLVTTGPLMSTTHAPFVSYSQGPLKSRPFVLIQELFAEHILLPYPLPLTQNTAYRERPPPPKLVLQFASLLLRALCE
jgi:hypothetical protein